MATYTEEQKKYIREMPAAVLLNAVLADPGSAIVGTRELLTGEKFISEAGSTYPGNKIIQDILQNVNLPKIEETVRPIFSIGKLEQMRNECIKKIQNGMGVLANDSEADQFKDFLLTLAEKVVNAAGEGFFGNRGQKVSANEAAFINDLKQKLSVSPTS